MNNEGVTYSETKHLGCSDRKGKGPHPVRTGKEKTVPPGASRGASAHGWIGDFFVLSSATAAPLGVRSLVPAARRE